MINRILAAFAISAVLATAADAPEVSISNGQLRVKMYTPDPANGFYKGARFDGGGIISSLEYAGHNYYGPWFTRFDPSVRDFSYQGDDIAVGPASSAMGPVEEFQTPLGFDAAKAGDRFVKIGVGVLKRTDETPYAFSKPYEIVDRGKWNTVTTQDSATFTQELSATDLGYGYIYTKTIHLTPGKPEMTIEHRLRNTGKLPISSLLYDHNFLTLDRLPTGDLTITTPYDIQPSRPVDPKFLQVSGKTMTYAKTLEGTERATAGLQGFGKDASDYDFRIENRKIGVGLRVQGDRPLQNVSLWSIRSVMAVEPFIEVKAEPGAEFTWKYAYTYYTMKP